VYGLFPSTILYEERVVVYESGIPSLAETERKLIMVKQGKEPIEKSLAANESLLLGQFSGATPAPAPTPTPTPTPAPTPAPNQTQTPTPAPPQTPSPMKSPIQPKRIRRE